MTLSSINTAPTYELTLPSNKKKLKYRPYNVGEQKNLLLAQLENNREATVTALKALLTNCTFQKFDVDNAPAFDIEYIMIQLRSKSAGEVVDVGVSCKGCEKVFPAQLNLEKVEVRGEPQNKVKLTEELYLIMKYPNLDSSVSFDPENIDSVFEQIAKCIDAIVYGEDIYDAKEQTAQELVKFVESLTEVQMNKVKGFFESIPFVVYEAEHNCSHCGHSNKVLLDNVSDFFM